MTELQKQNVSKMSASDLRELLDICIEELSVVDVNEAMIALKVGRQRVYQLMNDNNTLKIGKHKFLMLNT